MSLPWNYTRIKFNSSVVSTLDRGQIRHKILARLNEDDYTLTADGNSSISFKWNTFRFGSNLTILSRVNSGQFNFSHSEDGEMIKLTYFVSFFPELIMVTLIALFSLLIHHYQPLIIVIAFILQFLIRLANLERLSADLMENLK